MTVRVLVVDDDSRVRAALRLLLDSTADLRAVADVPEVDLFEDLLRASRPDVAVVDVQLPDVARGVAAIAAVARWLPVVALSVSRAGQAAARAAGAVSFVDKDGDADALLAAVRAAAGRPSCPA